MADESRDRSAYVTKLASELLADIELNRLAATHLVLKVSRLARMAGPSHVRRWLVYETHGYPVAQNDKVARHYMCLTGRSKGLGDNRPYYAGLPVLDAQAMSETARLNTIRGHSSHTFQEQSRKVLEIVAIRTRVISLFHDFVNKVHHEKMFSTVSGSIFEKFQYEVDTRLARSAPEVLKKLPDVYDRLQAGNAEAISQALTTCRRMIDAFADAIFPPSDESRDLGSGPITLGAKHQRNRINAYIHERTMSDSRRHRLRQTLQNLYDRVSAGVHSDVPADEARALILETYLFLGEVALMRKAAQ